jgi:hypothetical protein
LFQNLFLSYCDWYADCATTIFFDYLSLDCWKKIMFGKKSKRLHWENMNLIFSQCRREYIFFLNFAMIFLCGSLIAISTLFSSSALLMKCEILSCRWTRKFTYRVCPITLSTNSKSSFVHENQRKKHVQFGFSEWV